MIIGIILAILAAVTLIVELSTITFYLIAVAIALAVGSAVALAGAPLFWPFAAVAFTAGMGLPVAYIIRKRVMAPTTDSLRLSEDNIDHWVRVESVSPEGLRVSYRGTSWQANMSPDYPDYQGRTVEVGVVLRIVGRNGSDLVLGPADEAGMTKK